MEISTCGERAGFGFDDVLANIAEVVNERNNFRVNVEEILVVVERVEPGFEVGLVPNFHVYSL